MKAISRDQLNVYGPIGLAVFLLYMLDYVLVRFQSG